MILLIYWLTDWLIIDWVIDNNWLIHWLINWLIIDNWLIDWLLHWLTDELIDILRVARSGFPNLDCDDVRLTNVLTKSEIDSLKHQTRMKLSNEVYQQMITGLYFIMWVEFSFIYCHCSHPIEISLELESLQLSHPHMW